MMIFMPYNTNSNNNFSNSNQELIIPMVTSSCSFSSNQSASNSSEKSFQTDKKPKPSSVSKPMLKSLGPSIPPKPNLNKIPFSMTTSVVYEAMAKKQSMCLPKFEHNSHSEISNPTEGEELVSPKTRPKLGNYLILNTISRHTKCKIKLLLDTHTFKYYVLKIYSVLKMSSKILFEAEKKVLTALNANPHPNIIKLHEVMEDQSYKKRKGCSSHKFNGLVLEHAPYKDLFGQVQTKGGFSETVARTIFVQIIKGVQHIHENGYVHMDLKLENIFVGSDHNIKIGDFDLAQEIKTEQDTKLEIRGGTEQYMPPEYFMDTITNGQKVDVFSAGVVLFLLVYGHPPFKSSESNDIIYRFIKEKKYTKFWSIHERAGQRLHNDLKNLLMQMMEYDVEKRMTIEEILADTWCTGPLAEKEVLRKEIEERTGPSVGSVIEKENKRRLNQ